MPLDVATTAFLGQLAASGLPPLHTMPPAEARKVLAGMREMLGPGPQMVRVEDVRAETPGGSVPVRLLVPSAAPGGVIVYLHGGGWATGSLDEYDTLARKLAERTGCAVVLVDYRLAPEHPFPAAADDVWVAVQWAGSHLEQLAGKRVPLLVAGDSAGGNLAAVVVQRAHAHKGPPIAMQVLIYPVTDCVMETASYLDPANQLLVTRDSVRWFWDLYVPDAARREHPSVSPMRAVDLSGLPPAVVLTAEYDVVRDEGEAYAARLSAAGVAVEQRRFEGQMHTFFSMVMLPGSAMGLDYVGSAVRKCLASAST